MNQSIGKKVWAIAEGYIPGDSTTNGDKTMISHETVCVLNPNDTEANIELTVYFHDRDPAGPYQYKIPAQRTKHIRFNDLENPEVVPRDTDYSSVLRSDIPVVAQHTRLDSRQSANALLSTIAYSE